MKTKIAKLLDGVRAESPLVHHITNYVTVNDCANITLSIGASPVMADEITEVGDITSISSALVLNIGTLNQRTVASCKAAGKKANALNKPVVFDPVGAGASRLRTDTAKELLADIRFAVIRGNLSEIKQIAGETANTKGVDVSEKDASDLNESIFTAKAAAQKYKTVIAVTGKTDIVTDGERVLLINNGHKMLGSVSGTGCMCNSLIASYAGVTDDHLLAAAAGLVSMGVAGEAAFEKAGENGLGSFRIALIDAVSRLTPAQIAQRAKIDEA